MLVQAEVFPGKEPFPASGTPVPSCCEACHVTPDTASPESEVECPAGQTTIRAPVDVDSSAEGTFLGADLDRMIGPRVLFSFLITSGENASLQRLARADEHSIPLIVEVGTFVDELKVRNGKFRLAPLSAVPLRLNLLYPRQLIAFVGPALGLGR